jgi:hypothetical protein
MPRGGRRPGAGAPKGNMNNLKHGLYSRQFAQVGALLASNPTVRQALLTVAQRQHLQQQRADQAAALLLARLFQRAQSVASAAHPELVEACPERGESRSRRGPPKGRKTEPVEVGNRLNLELPVDDLDAINRAAIKEGRRQIRNAARRLTKSAKQLHGQSNPESPRLQSINAPADPPATASAKPQLPREQPARRRRAQS